MNIRSFISLLLFSVAVLALAGCPKPQNRPATVPASVITMMRESATAGQQGDQYQRSEDWANALDKYEAVVRSGDAALNEYQRLGIEPGNRHWLSYYLPALGHHDAALMQMQLQAPLAEINRHLQLAKSAISSAISIDHVNAGAAGSQYTGNAWKLFYFRANTSALLGDLASARTDYQQVAENLNKGYRPALDQMALIDYIEGRRSSDRSPGGLKFPDRSQLLSTKTKVDLVFIFSKYIFKQYAEEIGLAKNVTDALMADH